MQQSWKVEEPIDSSDPRSLRWDSPDGSCSLSVLGNRYFTGGIYYIAGISCEDGDFTFDSNDSPTDALVGVCMAANIDPSVYPFAEAIDDMYTIEEELIEIFHEPNQNHRSSPNDWGNDEWAERAMGFGLEPPEEPPY